MKKPRKVIFVAGARPNFMKIAPLIRACKKHRAISPLLVHTGQHYDESLSRVFFRELGIPAPDVNLEVGAGSQAEQTGKILIAFDAALKRYMPDLVVVVGDVNSTVACALAAAKRGIRVAHVEAGLRSFDWSMPEEINRVLTDRISDFLFCTEPSAVKNLLREGVDRKKIFLVGNVMIDTLRRHQKIAEKSHILQRFGLTVKHYALATLHRPSNVDSEKNLQSMVGTLSRIASTHMPLILPMHPRTYKNLTAWKIKTDHITVTDSLGYIDFLALMDNACMVLTDSGGIQEETTILGIPCLTLRENTERPITVTSGTNTVVGTNPQKILAAARRILKHPPKKKPAPQYWDGKAAERVIKVLEKKVVGKKVVGAVHRALPSV